MADLGDGSNHSWKIVTPAEGIKYSMPDTCSTCHGEQGSARYFARGELQKLLENRQGAITRALNLLEPRLEAAATMLKQLEEEKPLAAIENKPYFDVAVTNISLVKNDKSKGFHNPDYARALLEVAESKLKQFFESQGEEFGSLRSTENCRTCHQLFESHKRDWRTRHGLEARSPDARCNTCHILGSEAQGLGEQDFCQNCHQVQVPHDRSFIKNHGVNFNADPEQCATCHLNDQKVMEDAFANQTKVTGITKQDVLSSSDCRRCHAFGVPHTSGFASNHSIAQTARSVCLTCHSPSNPVNPEASYARSDFCTSCHTQKRIHGTRDEWVKIHPERFAAKGAEYCSTCHTRQSCQACHGEQQAHPTDWQLIHRIQVREPGTEACQTCHADPQFCTSCHSRQ